MEGEDRGADRRNKPSAIVKYRQVSLQNPPSWPIVDGPPLAPIYMMVLARGAYRGLDFEDMPPTIPTFRTHVTLTALLGFGKATRRVVKGGRGILDSSPHVKTAGSGLLGGGAGWSRANKSIETQWPQDYVRVSGLRLADGWRKNKTAVEMTKWSKCIHFKLGRNSTEKLCI